MELNIKIMFFCDSLVRTLGVSHHWTILWVRQLSRLSVPAEAVVHSQTSACEICGGQISTSIFSVFCCQYNSTVAAHSLIHLPLTLYRYII